MKSHDERIQELEIKKQQLQARIDKHKALNSAQKRKQDTRRKILLGAWVLKRIEIGELSNEEVIAAMDKFLNKNIDRKLFDLQPKDKKNQDS